MKGFYMTRRSYTGGLPVRHMLRAMNLQPMARNIVCGEIVELYMHDQRYYPRLTCSRFT